MRSRRTLREDDRAIEGLPMRLIIALVVGVASLTLMMNMLGGFGGLQETELDADTDPDVVDINNAKDVNITVEESSGEAVEGATVVIKSGTASVSSGSMKVGTTGSDGNVTLAKSTISSDISLNGKDQGYVTIQIIPPDDGDYKSDEGDGKITFLG